MGENERDEESVRMKKIEIEMCDSRNWEHEQQQQQQEKRPEPEHCRKSKNEKNRIQTEKEHARKATLNGYIM